MGHSAAVPYLAGANGMAGADGGRQGPRRHTGKSPQAEQGHGMQGAATLSYTTLPYPTPNVVLGPESAPGGSLAQR